MAAIDVIIPVYNEQEALPQNIPILHGFLKENMSQSWTITIADNGSTDKTMTVASALSKQYPGVRVVHLDQKGRGRALRKIMVESPADIVSYMDVDLSTGLEAFPPMIKAVEEGYGIAMGSRLMPGAKVQRCFKREFVSRVYNILIKIMFFTRFYDAQCGFKALSRKVAQDILPLVENNMWFFDTEMLLLALKRGYRVKEIPVVWSEDPGTTVHVGKTAVEDIKGLLRMRFHPTRGLGKVKKIDREERSEKVEEGREK